MAPDDLLAALATGDTARLATIPGIGEKTAQRMIVDLKDRVQKLAAELPKVTATAPLEEDLVLALVNLGYREGEAQRAIAQARSESPDATTSHELLRASLQKLSRV
jgi:Holliday junction DNA helicase RuvA